MGVIYTLSDKKIEGATPLSLIQQHFFPKPLTLEPYDALLVTSKNTAKALEAVAPIWKQKKLYTFGQETFNYIQKLGGADCELLNAKTGDDFALLLSDKLKRQKVLYPRAKTIHSHIKEILTEQQIDIDEIIVYETVCSPSDTTLEKNSVIVFSSPSTIRCFFKNYDWHPSHKVVCIGSKTAAFMPEGIDVIISETNSLEACVKKAKELLCSSL